VGGECLTASIAAGKVTQAEEAITSDDDPLFALPQKTDRRRKRAMFAT
jgi:hypothetical protein